MESTQLRNFHEIFFWICFRGWHGADAGYIFVEVPSGRFFSDQKSGFLKQFLGKMLATDEILIRAGQRYR
jgi:hypothetical protein